MPLGPGKYDHVCTMVREQVGVSADGGGVIVIVLGGNKGNGFSCQADIKALTALPDILESVAKQMREG